MLRSLALAVVLAALAPATAGAVVGERIIPFYDADDGVRVVDTPRGKVVRFDRTKRASKAWRKISGRRTAVECDVPGGSAGTSRGPRERDRRVLLPAGPDSDVCTISTRGRGDGAGCLDDETERGFCVRAVVALTDAGRLHVEETIASWDLLTVGLSGEDPRDFSRIERVLGDLIVRLPGPGASPPAGAIGLWTSGDDIAIVVFTTRGARRFLSVIGGVFSTNAKNLVTFAPPSLIP
jgi:hypothetical protein